MEPQLLVEIPNGTPEGDIRWCVMRMVAHLDRRARVANARVVLANHERSEHVTAEHQELARAIIAGPGDLLGAKMSHEWDAAPPGYGPNVGVCARCDAFIDGDLAFVWCPGTEPTEGT